MAFIDFEFGSTARVNSVAEAVDPTTVALSALDEAAVEIGSHDPLHSIRTGRSPGRLVERFFGFRRSTPLADPHLEAIRRLAVAAHLGKEKELVREVRTAMRDGIGAIQTMLILARFGRSVPA